jgi:DNA polymerase III delta prime subunit
MPDLSKMWVESHRPKTLNEYIFQNKLYEKSFRKMAHDRSVPHLLLSGVAGTGKTTLSKILVREMRLEETDVLLINSSDENSVDVMRDKIKTFIMTYAMGPFKIVQLEEADYITPNGQAVLRQMMEEYADFARFILTCNNENRIINPIKSRCQHFRFKAFDKTDVAAYVMDILEEENISFNEHLALKYVEVGYPDIRKILNAMQQNTVDNALQPPSEETQEADYKFKMLELLETDQWLEIRKMLCASVPTEEWDSVYRFLYENLEKSSKFSEQKKWEQGIVILADHLYRDTMMADREINFAACAIRLCQL